MWDAIFRRWIDLLFWWAPRKQEAPRERAPEPAPRAAEPGAGPAPKQPAQRPAEADSGAARAAAPSARPAARPPSEQPARGAEAQASRAAEPRARPAPEPSAAQPAKTVAPPVPDDLTVIKGIGPAMQNKLRALGITTFADLAGANPDELMARLKGSQPLSIGRVRHWTEAARERART